MERHSLTHKFNIAGHEGYITVGIYPNGQPGEIFIMMAKEGSTIGGLMDSFALAVSMSLQHGVPLRLLCDKFKHTRFEPAGWTGNENIGYATSIMDYLFRWLEQKFITGQQQFLFPQMRPKSEAQSNEAQDLSASGVLSSLHGASAGAPASSSATINSAHAADNLRLLVDLGDAPSCHVCGSIMTRNGSCYRCMSCGSTSGCS